MQKITYRFGNLFFVWITVLLYSISLFGQPTVLPKPMDVTVSGAKGSSAANENNRYVFQGDWNSFFDSSKEPEMDTAIKALTSSCSLVPSMDGTTGYCLNAYLNKINVINLATQEITNTLTLNQSNPILMAISRDLLTGHDIGYTINSSSHTVSQIDLTEGNILQTVETCLHPRGIIVHSATAGTGAIAYVSNSMSGSISRIDFSLSPPAVTVINTNIGSENRKRTFLYYSCAGWIHSILY